MRWRPRGRLTIATRLVASFLLMASLPLIVVLFLSTRSDESDLKSKGFATVNATAGAKADRIEAFTTEHREAAVALARTPAVADRFRRLEIAVQASGVDSAEYAQVEASLRPFFSRYLRDFGFTDLFLMATTGEGVFAVNEREGLGFNYETGPFKGTERAVAFRRVRDSKALTLVGFDSFSVNSRSAYIALPLNDASGVIGVAVFEVGKEPVFTVVGDHGGLGETGETLLGVRRDDAVVIVAPARFDDELPKGRSIGAGSTERGLRAAVDGQAGQGEVRDYRGKRTLAAWRPLPVAGAGPRGEDGRLRGGGPGPGAAPHTAPARHHRPTGPGGRSAAGRPVGLQTDHPAHRSDAGRSPPATGSSRSPSTATTRSVSCPRPSTP